MVSHIWGHREIQSSSSWSLHIKSGSNDGTSITQFVHGEGWLQQICWSDKVETSLLCCNKTAIKWAVFSRIRGELTLFRGINICLVVFWDGALSWQYSMMAILRWHFWIMALLNLEVMDKASYLKMYERFIAARPDQTNFCSIGSWLVQVPSSKVLNEMRTSHFVCPGTG